ncbi:MAG: DUF4382 domain-containing protein [Idiomarina sp.]|nr:DUF4382 domain-containing protein [Idiomarina sp.]
MKRSVLAVAVCMAAVGLVACDSSTENDDGMARFSLGVSDAPVNSANEVVVCFESVQLVGNGQPPQRFFVGDEGVIEPNNVCLDDTGNVVSNTVGIDLLTLQGATAEQLVENAPVEPGQYGQLRLDISEGSYVETTEGERVGLRVPSGQLRLDGPTLTANQTFSYTVEFDLRKALVAPPGLPHYLLQPRGVRLVDNAQIGHMEGEVAELLLMDAGCPVGPADASVPFAALYLYEGLDKPLDEMSDNSDEENGPYASVSVFFHESTATYPFSIGYIAEGDYTLALTCEIEDDPEEETELTFVHSQNITITAGDTLEVIVD